MEVSKRYQDFNFTDNEVQESLLRQVFDNLDQAVCLLDKDYTIVFLNKNAHRFSEKIIGNTIDLGETVWKLSRPERKDTFKVILDKAFAGEKVRVINNFEGKSGDEYWFEFIFSPIVGKSGQCESLLVNIVDLTEHLASRDDILILHQAIEQSPVSIVITDTVGNIEYVNDAFTRISGYENKEVRGKNPRILKSGLTTKEQYQEIWTTITGGEVWKGEFYNRKKDGSFYWETATISPVRGTDGRITHFVGVKEDITERKRIHQQLVMAKEKAEESERIKMAFLNNVSHEIRTPLNGILGFSELLRSTCDIDPKQFSYIDVIEKCSFQLLGVMNNILEIAMIEKENIELVPSDCYLPHVINDLYEYYMVQLDELGKRNLVLTKHIVAPDIEMVWLDGARLYQVFMNLINNAVKFTGKGIVEFGYVQMKDDLVRFFVKDSGIGIPEEKLNLIFEPFRQADESVSRTYGGSGLGLSICKMLVERMGGKLWVESEIGKGSAFYFEIKLKRCNLPGNELAPRIPEQYRWQNRQMLIVENNYNNYMLLKETVNDTSVIVFPAHTGTAAMDIIRGNPDIDLMLVDTNLPDFNGFELVTDMKKMRPDLYVIGQTSYSTFYKNQKAMRAGFDELLTKPVPRKNLLAAINKGFEKTVGL